MTDKPKQANPVEAAVAAGFPRPVAEALVALGDTLAKCYGARVPLGTLDQTLASMVCGQCGGLGVFEPGKVPCVACGALGWKPPGVQVIGRDAALCANAACGNQAAAGSKWCADCAEPVKPAAAPEDSVACVQCGREIPNLFSAFRKRAADGGVAWLCSDGCVTAWRGSAAAPKAT